MSKSKFVKRDLYYTDDHEWIDYQGSVAYVGICEFKLKGIKQVHQMLFPEMQGVMKKGEVIATIHYEDYKISIHMPVDGKIVSINEALLPEGNNLLLTQPENNGWVALIVPSQPYERKGLLQPEQYRILTKRKF